MRIPSQQRSGTKAYRKQRQSKLDGDRSRNSFEKAGPGEVNKQVPKKNDCLDNRDKNEQAGSQPVSSSLRTRFLLQHRAYPSTIATDGRPSQRQSSLSPSPFCRRA